MNDHLQHHGVKGMKWGVRRARKALSSAGKSTAKALNKARDKHRSKVDAYHEKNKNKTMYKLSYNHHKRSAKGKTAEDKHRWAVRSARAEAKMNKALLTSAAATGLMTSKTVRNTVYGLAKKATSPEAVRLGKNIVQAAKRSPVRYVDGKTLKNVVNMTNQVMR